MPALRDLTVEWVSLVDRAAVRDPQNKSEPMRLLLWKREDTTDGGSSMTAEETQALEKAEQEKTDAVARAEKAEKDAADAQAELKKYTEGEDGGPYKAKKGGTDATGADENEAKKAEIDKSELSPEVRALVEKAEKTEAEAEARIAKAEAKASEASDIAKAERDARETREFIAKAAEFKALPVEADKFGPILKSVHGKLTKDEADEIDRILKAADEQIRQSDLFKEMGRSGTPSGAAAGSALEKVQQKAEELRKADSSLTAAQAMQKAMEGDRELQAEYLAETR